jgi:predicted DCC family thiol-disulfide oxidoreductase YuxK
MDSNDNRGLGGWVLYDAECRFCRGWAEWFSRPLRARGFQIVPLQTDWVRERLKLPTEKLLEEMRVIPPNGPILGGIDAVLYLSKTIWWTSPLYWMSFIPGAKCGLQTVYQSVAKRRQCLRVL